jgi:ADP-ribosylglycohydrolase
MPTRAERIEGGLLGLLVGDALGVPYEFKPADELPSAAQIELEPPSWFPRSHDGVRPGTWSDDGAQALCLLESLLLRGGLDPEDFGRRLVRWYEQGHMAVGGRVFDVGAQTARALDAIRDGVPVLEAGPNEASANGNGSLMRVLPLALWHRGSDEALVREARLSSVVTHGHLRSQLCCALYCLWAWRTLDEQTDAWPSAVTTLRALVRDDELATTELEHHVRPDSEPVGHGSGYVVDTLHGARGAMSHDSFEAVVKAAVSLGDDTDTTAAVAGGLAGLRHGVDAIPERWRAGLRGRETLVPLVAELLDVVSAR